MQYVVKALNKLYLFYLGVLPSIATFFLVSKLENIETYWFLIFIIGTALVGVYLAMIGSYHRQIGNIWILLLVLVDGPILSILTNLNYLDISNIIITNFFIENMAIWLSIGVLALISGRPSKNQLIASLVLTFIIIGGLVVLYYFLGFFNKAWYLFVPLVFGIFETFWIKYKLLDEDDVVDEDNAATYIIIYIMLWVGCMIGSSAVSNTQY